eukprot:Lankesteria_metandrocarpae@DN2675_c0_g1_i1.p1
MCLLTNVRVLPEQFAICFIAPRQHSYHEAYCLRRVSFLVAQFAKNLEAACRFFSTEANDDVIGKKLYRLRRQLNGTASRVFLRFTKYDYLDFSVTATRAMSRKPSMLSSQLAYESVPLPVVDIQSMLWSDGMNAIQGLLMAGGDDCNHRLVEKDICSLRSLDIRAPILPLYYNLNFIKIISLVDGVRSVAQIARLSKVAPFSVIESLMPLVDAGAVVPMDMFDLRNMYRVEPGWEEVLNRMPTHTLANFVTGGVLADNKDIHLLEAVRLGTYCLYRRIVASDFGANAQRDRDTRVLYCAPPVDPSRQRELRAPHPASLYKIYIENYSMLKSLQISLRHFIAFGAQHRTLRRIHELPVLVPRDELEDHGSDINGFVFGGGDGRDCHDDGPLTLTDQRCQFCYHTCRDYDVRSSHGEDSSVNSGSQNGGVTGESVDGNDEQYSRTASCDLALLEAEVKNADCLDAIQSKLGLTRCKTYAYLHELAVRSSYNIVWLCY